MRRHLCCPYCRVEVLVDGQWRQLPDGTWARHTTAGDGMNHCETRPYAPYTLHVGGYA